MYYEAKTRALNNGRQYHLAALLKRRGRIVRIGINSSKIHPRFKRQYNDGTWAAHMHAEMDVLRFAEPGDEIEVMRFRKCKHTLAMARPCDLCMVHMREAGIKTVRYTNERGEWVEISP